MIHRDIAARNMLVGQNWGKFSVPSSIFLLSSFTHSLVLSFLCQTEVYVSDFGLARVKSAEQSSAVTMQNFGPIGVSTRPFILLFSFAMYIPLHI